MQKLCHRICIGLLAVAVLVGCSRSTIDSSPFTPALEASIPAPQIKSGDRLKIIVFGQNQPSTDYTVGANGLIQMPAVGAVKAAGLTTSALEQVIADKLRASAGMQNPQVSVLIDTGSPFYIIGEVRNPGEFNLTPDLDARAAIALAGGYTGDADTARIYITRAGSTGEKAYTVGSAPRINSGDVLRIPKKD